MNIMFTLVELKPGQYLAYWRLQWTTSLNNDIIISITVKKGLFLNYIYIYKFMQSRLTNSNQNYKVFARVRPIDYQQKMVEVTNECVSIRVIKKNYLHRILQIKMLKAKQSISPKSVKHKNISSKQPNLCSKNLQKDTIHAFLAMDRQEVEKVTLFMDQNQQQMINQRKEE